MASLVVASQASTGKILPALLAAAFINHHRCGDRIDIDYAASEQLDERGSVVCFRSSDGRESLDDASLTELAIRGAGSNPALQRDVKEWLERSRSFENTTFKTAQQPLGELDRHLTLRTYISGYRLTLADVYVYAAIRSNRFATAGLSGWTNVPRWFSLLESTQSWISEVRSGLNTSINRAKANQEESASMTALAARMVEGPVVTRFPPEPSGYLHIGHAKAALLNDILAHEGGGKMVCRFDDTNPSKESLEFQDSILDDLAAMGVKPDRVTYSSDYFDDMF
ncbi:hypothetical protein CAC42_1713 [Sphaceloma murrayae]|uniref:Glutamyl/glutaminyl-tRNA synthetase class Ib catalytic domain-containing protein n=1 Tax=Sphaceloma murrayae TaxID=2082308 RepID=A0A2K1QIC2_9PEZI|nr:hypothetical protein CAC42_1713 [Sphaceloma murrayae]